MASKSASSNIHHFHAVRIRLKGTGNMLLTLNDMDSIITQPLVNLAMTPTTNRELTRLSNFTTQRMQLELKTTVIDEIFSVSKITIFAKPVATSFPG